VAGANGVGKTSYALRSIRALSGSIRFLNLDEIARGLSPLDPEAERVEAARVALARFEALVAGNGRGGDFTLETTLAGRTYLRRLADAKRRGWRVHLLYFAVASPEIALERIARRVAEGGHAIPEAEARRRFARSLRNLPGYIALADLWRVLDHNGPRPVTAAEGRAGCIAFSGERAGLPAELAASLARLPACG